MTTPTERLEAAFEKARREPPGSASASSSPEPDAPPAQEPTPATDDTAVVQKVSVWVQRSRQFVGFFSTNRYRIPVWLTVWFFGFLVFWAGIHGGYHALLSAADHAHPTGTTNSLYHAIVIIAAVVASGVLSCVAWNLTHEHTKKVREN